MFVASTTLECTVYGPINEKGVTLFDLFQTLTIKVIVSVFLFKTH